MIKEKIKAILERLTGHQYIEIILRGNAAITAALSIFPKESIILIPEEGGWIHYKKAPAQVGSKTIEIRCDDARINLPDLEEKLKRRKCAAFLYQNPGGYFAEQPMREIYVLCQKYHCLVIMDVSGAIGTPLCNGKYADILVGSFGEWKLVEAKIGGFISSNDKDIWKKVITTIKPLEDAAALQKIEVKLRELPQRIEFLQRLKGKIIQDLRNYSLVYPTDRGFVVIVKYNSETEKQKVINYCIKNKYHYTECPRYIRINKPAISIELKREQE